MKIWTAILSVLLLSTSQSSIAASVGTITEHVDSPAQIQRKKTMVAGSKGTSVEMEDEINTRRGKVGIVFVDDTKVQVNEGSKLVIDDFVYDPNKKVGKLALNMAQGTVRYASGQIAKTNPASVAVNTPTATVAVRGTDFTATVDELGGSTIILLPSCPRKNMLPDEIEKQCKTGVIDVKNDAGTVTLDVAFQATSVTSRNIPPTKPVTLKLNEDAINNMLILSPPQEIKRAIRDQRGEREEATTALSQNFLGPVDLGNVLAAQNSAILTSQLARNFLDNEFLANILQLSNEELSITFGNLIAPQKNEQILPDYKKSSGVVAIMDTVELQLCRPDSSANNSCISTPKTQHSTITITQGSTTVINRVNQGNNTTIVTKQN